MWLGRRLAFFLSFGGDQETRSGVQKWKGPLVEAGASVLVVIRAARPKINKIHYHYHHHHDIIYIIYQFFVAVSVKTGVIIIFFSTLTFMSLTWSKSGTGLGLLRSQTPRQVYSFLMIRKKLSYNIQSMLTMPAFRGFHPNDSGSATAFVSSGQL